MVGRRRNAMTTQSLRRTREPVMVLHGVLVSGPITALAAASPRQKVYIFGRRMPGPCGVRKEGPQGRQGSVTPFALRQRPAITEPWTSPDGCGADPAAVLP